MQEDPSSSPVGKVSRRPKPFIFFIHHVTVPRFMGAQQHRERPWANLGFNILIPVVVLQQLSRRLGEDGPLIALLVALAFPVAYGLWDWWKFQKRNVLSILGVLSVLFTGGFALLELSPEWFAVKEATFPALIGLGVWWSASRPTPFLKAILLNDQLLAAEKIQSRLRERNNLDEFDQLIRRATRWSAWSFALSAGLNYLVAKWVFVSPPPDSSATERTALINEQVAKMTGYGFVIIALPMTLVMGVIFWRFIRELQALTDLEFEELLPQPAPTQDG